MDTECRSRPGSRVPRCREHRPEFAKVLECLDPRLGYQMESFQNLRRRFEALRAIDCIDENPIRPFAGRESPGACGVAPIQNRYCVALSISNEPDVKYDVM